MTPANLPARLADLQSAVASGVTCSLATLEALETALSIHGPVAQKPGRIKNHGSKVSASIQAKKQPSKPQKSRGFRMAEDLEQQEKPLSVAQQIALATNVVNSSLKSLTNASKERSSGAIRQHGYSTPSKGSKSTTSPRHTNVPMQTPLCPISANIQVAPRNLPSKTKRSPSQKSEDGIRAQILCTKMAFEKLLALQDDEGDQSKAKTCQLEKGVSALIHRCIALDQLDLAVQIIQALRSRLILLSSRGDALAKSSIMSHRSKVEHRCDKKTVPVAELLGFGQHQVPAHLLALVSATQLQIIRLIALGMVCDHELLAKQLNVKNPCSPVNMIMLQINDTTSRDKAAHELEVLAQLLSNISGASGSNEASISDSSALGCLRLQCLSLVIKSQWWNMVNHEIDSHKEICLPFLNAIKNFEKMSSTNKEDNFHSTRSAYVLIEREGLFQKFPDQDFLPIFHKLLELAQAAALNKEARYWLERASACSDQEQSPLRQCIISCHHSTLQVRESIQREDFTLEIETLKEVGERFTGNLHGDSREVDELLIAVSSLRRSLSSYILLRRRTLGDDCTTEPSSTVLESLKVITLCMRFLFRYFGQMWAPTDDQMPFQQIEHRSKMRSTVAVPAILDICVLSKIFSKACKEIWKHIELALTDSTSLVTILARKARNGDLDHERLLDEESLEVKLSDCYWLRYQQLKKQNSAIQDLAKCLASSIHIIQQDQVTDNVYETLASRRESYARLYEGAKQNDKALQICKQTIDLHLQRHIIDKVVKAARRKPLDVAFEESEQARILKSSLHAHVRMASKVIESNDLVCGYYDMDALPVESRLVLLNHQFSVLLSQIGPREPSSPTISQLHRLAKVLHGLYSERKFPIRRLFFLTQLLVFQITQPAIVQESILLSELEDCGHNTTHILSNYDKELETYQNNLVEQKMLLVAMTSEPADIGAIERTLKSWYSMFKDLPDGEDQAFYTANIYERRVLDSLLGLAVKYLEYQGVPSLAALALNICRSLRGDVAKNGSTCELAISAKLALQYGRLGYTNTGIHVAMEAKQSIEDPTVSAESAFCWHNALANLYLDNNRPDLCRYHVEKASATLHNDHRSDVVQTPWYARLQIYRKTAEVHQVQSKLAAREGDVFEALLFARYSVKNYESAWTMLEKRAVQAANNLEERSCVIQEDSLTDGLSNLGVADREQLADKPVKEAQHQSIQFWEPGSSLVEALIHLSDRLSHVGLFPEVEHYLNEALKIAKSIGVPKRVGQCCITLSEHAIRSDKPLIAQDNIGLAEDCLKLCLVDYEIVMLKLRLVKLYEDLGQTEKAISSLDEVSTIVTEQDMLKLAGHSASPAENLREKMAGLSLGSSVGTTGGSNINVRAKTPKPKLKHHLPTAAPQVSGSSLLAGLEHLVMYHEASILLTSGDTSKALEILLQADISSFGENSPPTILRSRLQLNQGMKAIASHPVFGILSESTISYPGVSSSQNTLNRVPTSKQPLQPRRKVGRAAARKAKDEEPVPMHFGELQECRTHVLNPMRASIQQLHVNVIYQLSQMLSKVMMVLAILPSSTREIEECGAFLVLSIELPRVISMLRASIHTQVERQVLKQPALHLAETKIEEYNDFAGLASLSVPQFSKAFLETLPATWNIVCLTLGEQKEELLMSRLRSEEHPLTLRTPFKRQSAIKCDEETFDFAEAKKEMTEIVELANQSSQNGGDIINRDDKVAWWDLRRSLDKRLGDLLSNMEGIWLGGFRGIFDSRRTTLDSLAKFEESLHFSLGKYLPSRQKSGASTTAHLLLDSQIVGLFTALGAPSDNNDIDEQVLDLMYFVVDSLQFKGERNAYDEIDFDSLVIETVDSLRQYHLARNDAELEGDGQHTILILDKNLHCFPWESLPCLKGKSVSRLPSLMCLHERLLSIQQMQSKQSSRTVGQQGCTALASRNNGAYILNPSGDLANTQERFEAPLSMLAGWDGATEQKPSEQQFKDYLENSDVFLYFGHGSGGQYIRSRTIKKLKRCAVSLLMGCSSGMLNEAGEYEPYGKPLDYMLAGSPALLANLWDVTDKDIDKFAQSVLEKWGLFGHQKTVTAPKSPVKRGRGRKGKGVATELTECEEADRTPMPLDKAVAKSRDVCMLKYLNGAAPVIYGVPVMLE